MCCENHNIRGKYKLAQLRRFSLHYEQPGTTDKEQFLEGRPPLTLDPIVPNIFLVRGGGE